MKKQQIIKIIISVLIAALTALGAALGLQSCNVVRTITNKSKYYQRGDTSVNELFARQRFAAVKAAVKARKEDMSKVDADQAAFIAQKNTPGGKKTMKAYLWSLELATYDQAHPRS